MARSSSFSRVDALVSAFSTDEVDGDGDGDGDMCGNSNTHGDSNMESLPNEVLIKIAQNIQGDQKVATLRDLCKVSRRMDSIARKELYHTVTADNWASLRRLYRTIEDCPALAKSIVELELLFPGHRRRTSAPSWAVLKLDDSDIAMLYFLFLGILKGTASLRKLNIMLGGSGPRLRTGGPHDNLYEDFITKLCQIIEESQHGGSTAVALPFLEHVRLGASAAWEARHPVVYRHLELAQPFLFLPFLNLPSISTLESIDDSGVWPGTLWHRHCYFKARYNGHSDSGAYVHPYHQIKSVVLRESNCLPMDLMDVCNIFPDLHVFFCQNREEGAMYDLMDAANVTDAQVWAAPSARRYLTDSFGKLQSLQSLALVPLIAEKLESLSLHWKTWFSGPSGFLSLTRLPALTSLATLISVFASPDGKETGILTASPMEVLPRSLRSLQIIVDPWTSDGLERFPRPLDETWFQPREAAIKFLSTLSGICAREFPALREVEYVWAVDRTLATRVDYSYGCNCSPPKPKFCHRPHLHADFPVQCGGLSPLCCDTHTRIQALSPDEDYTSRAEGIVSPFKDRFDSLGVAFNEANVVFRIVELKEYSDFYDHWQGGRK